MRATFQKNGRQLIRNAAIWCVATALTAMGASSALAQAPSITYLSPPGAQRGTTVDVTIHGASLAGASAIWTDLPISATVPHEIPNNGKDAAKVVVRVQIPADTPV